jgi:hypothetical protein
MRAQIPLFLRYKTRALRADTTRPVSIDHLDKISSQVRSLASQAPAVPVVTTDLAVATNHLRFQQGINFVAFADVLIQYIGRFASMQISIGVIPTDKVFRRESRRVMFEDKEDNWNQTLVDHQDGLQAFWQQNGWQR